MNAAQFDYLIVGAGIYGATAARVLTEAGKSVAVIDRRDVVAGNCYDEDIEGIRFNLYGGHIFHTNSERVWNFVNRFAQWQSYIHRVSACVDGKLYSFPPNLLTLNQIWGIKTPQDAAVAYNDMAKMETIREMFFRGYSEKQWGKPYSQIPSSVTARIPLRTTYDDRYFTDKYQALPVNGYTAFVRALLKNIPLALGCDYLESREYWNRKAERVIYTGPIDELFGYEYGALEYRSLRFEHFSVEGDFQGCATINYPERRRAYTRVLEHKHFGWQQSTGSIVTMEYPETYERGTNEPYYPVRDEANAKLYEQYKARAAAERWLIIGGRLGMFQYLNMDQAIGAAITTAERLIGGG